MIHVEDPPRPGWPVEVTRLLMTRFAHVFGGDPAVVAEIERVLAPGGVLAVCGTSARRRRNRPCRMRTGRHGERELAALSKRLPEGTWRRKLRADVYLTRRR